MVCEIGLKPLFSFAVILISWTVVCGFSVLLTSFCDSGMISQLEYHLS